MTIIAPALAAAIAGKGIPLSADMAPQGAERERSSEVQALIAAELPRRTGMHIDPNERWDAQTTKKALAGLDDAGIISRRNWLLASCADMPKQHEAALCEYALHLSREMNRRRISLVGGESR